MNETFKRGQVEWALWHFYECYYSPLPEKVSKVFQSRIKRLLDIDRAKGYYAFSEEKPSQGSDTEFTLFNVFCLLMALELVGIGFKQSEVVFLLQHVREDFRIPFERLRTLGVPQQGYWTLKQELTLPQMWDGSPRADHRVFALIRKLEMTEMIPEGMELEADGTPFTIPPIICEGSGELIAQLSRELPWRCVTTVVMELSRMVSSLALLLPKAPNIRRGRA